MAAYFSTTAIVINKRRLRESDFLITLLTPQQGKIIALAKGAATIKSRRLSCLQLGNIVKIQLYQKGESLWLSEAQALESFLTDPKRLVQYNLLFYFLELVNLLIAENQRIDGAYPTCLKIIQNINRNRFRSYIYHEIELIRTLGFGIPPEIDRSFKQGDLPYTQKLIKHFFESIVEKPLQSNRLFR